MTNKNIIIFRIVIWNKKKIIFNIKCTNKINSEKKKKKINKKKKIKKKKKKKFIHRQWTSLPDDKISVY